MVCADSDIKRVKGRKTVQRLRRVIIETDMKKAESKLILLLSYVKIKKSE